MAEVDSDGDGLSNYAEFISGFDPTNAASVFKVESFSLPEPSNAFVVVSWTPVEGRIYNIEWSDHLQVVPFSSISGDLPYPANSYTDSVERTGPQQFYLIDVRLEP